MDEDNDGRFPDNSQVEIHYPRSREDESGDRSHGRGRLGRFYSSAGQMSGLCAWRYENWRWPTGGRRRAGRRRGTCLTRAVSGTVRRAGRAARASRWPDERGPTSPDRRSASPATAVAAARLIHRSAVASRRTRPLPGAGAGRIILRPY
jgi:hypothetical protein